ncbi:MAG: hypothetical protein L0229_20265 [Blastocatellia bacterium]|nr:hypothetical protein [Blastocatellia bacterium]
MRQVLVLLIILYYFGLAGSVMLPTLAVWRIVKLNTLDKYIWCQMAVLVGIAINNMLTIWASIDVPRVTDPSAAFLIKRVTGQLIQNTALGIYCLYLLGLLWNKKQQPGLNGENHDRP